MKKPDLWVKSGSCEETKGDFGVNGGFLKGKSLIFQLNRGGAKRKYEIFA